MKKCVFAIYMLLLVNAALCKLEDEGMDNNYYDTNTAIIDLVKGKFGITMYHKLRQTFEEIKEKCPKIEENLTEKFEEVREFVEKLDISDKTICQTIEEYYEIRVKPFVNTVSPCLPEESHNIPLILAKVIGTFIDELCHSTLEQLLELLHPCQFTKSFNDVKSCNDIKTYIDNFQGKRPSSSFICTLIPLTRDCSKERHDSSCKNPISKRAFTHFYDRFDDATRSICEKNNVV